MPENTRSNIIDGSGLSEKIRGKIAKDISELKEGGVSACLAAVLVGDDPGSKIYVKMKHKACEKAGIKSITRKFPPGITEDELALEIDQLNRDDSIDGILVQLPLPRHINERKIMERIDPLKDVDGFNPVNMGNLAIGAEKMVPCTPKGIIRMLEEYNVKLEGAEAVVVNHSSVVGKPLAMLLLNRNATVSVCHVFTKNLASYTRDADIVIVGAGVPKLIKADMIKEGAVVIDVGINRVEDKIVGDVDFDNVSKKAGLITPVPGGVGPMTITMLLENTVICARNRL